jgi:anhydro-N-acetylmuramic acid kinase
VTAIGCHGQTVRHRPREFDGVGYTIQLNAPALLAELTGIDVVADFRSRDVAAGGQGAPLVPAFHRAMFERRGTAVAVLNLGGIANLTVLDGLCATTGFDCGPANALLDHWCNASTGRRFDAAGAWAASGTVDPRLLGALLDEPYFALAPPKSTGRDLFHGEWLEARLLASDARRRLRAEDIQATLAELTAQACARALGSHGAGASEVIVCGGGAFNVDLMGRLRRSMAPAPVVESGARGLPPDQVEATAFAWLARAFLRREPGNMATVTGAAGPRILGALHPTR